MTGNVARLRNEVTEALDVARMLARCGVPVFVAKPDKNSKIGFKLPRGWQNSDADESVVDTWREGDALCAVMGRTVDGADFDLQKEGALTPDTLKKRGVLPRVYGVASTPSGGEHHLVAPLGVHSRNNVDTGFDVKAGVGDEGLGFLFIAPTMKPSKVTGDPQPYRWVTEPREQELAGLELVGADGTGAELARLVESKHQALVAYAGPAYAGPAYAELPAGLKKMADLEVDAIVDAWRDRLEAAADWPEGQTYTNSSGEVGGWDMLLRDWAWTVARLVLTPWNGLTAETGEDVYTEAVPAPFWAVRDSKWGGDLLARAATGFLVPQPSWVEFGVVREDEIVDVSNEATAARWLLDEIGKPGTPLAGLFLRGEQLVHTPRIAEEGYLALTSGARDLDGPAQIRPANADRVLARIQFSYNVVRTPPQKKRPEPCIFPLQSVKVVLGDTTLAPNLRRLRGVTHTPTLRANGTVLDRVGYDEESQRLFLPDAGFEWDPVPETPTPTELESARELVLEMLEGFPFNTPHDRANYLGMLFTPLLRELVPPPYKLGIINAHQAGSGKSLLGALLREIHGGVLRGDLSNDNDEIRKQLSSVMYNTTAPVVQFDNVRHLQSTHLDMLLTSPVWSDRILGSTNEIKMRNDRQWVATGNNVSLGGDLARRCSWCTIDPKVPNPQARTDFKIKDLLGWTQINRGRLVSALLTIVRAWVVAGQPGEQVGSDTFAAWTGAVRGILAVGGFEGIFEHADTQARTASEEIDEWGVFLTAVHDKYGTRPWTAAQVADEVVAFGEVAPDGMKANSRSVGKWLAHREGQYSENLSVRKNGVSHKTVTWKIEVYETDDLL